MAKPKRTLDSELEKEMQKTAREWTKLREMNKLSQTFLSEIIGVSRRTIQSIEAGKIIPQAATIKKFEELRSKYEREGKPTGRRKRKSAQGE